MVNSTFKLSTLTEMCDQIKSAPVIFKLKDGTSCLAFYNHEDCIKASKLYIIFPNTSHPKYIEGNDLYNLRKSIIHNVSKNDAILLYNKVNKHHKEGTINFINSLIDKTININDSVPEKIVTSNKINYNKKHACAWVKYDGKDTIVFVKDLKNNQALEVIINNTIKYNVVFDCIYWVAGISAKDFTNLKISIEEYNA